MRNNKGKIEYDSKFRIYIRPCKVESSHLRAKLNEKYKIRFIYSKRKRTHNLCFSYHTVFLRLEIINSEYD